MKRLPLGLVIGLFAVVMLWNLGALNVTIMEARNFVTAREMVEDGSYLIPTLNDEYRLQKPPLPTWMTAVVVSLLNTTNEFWLRLPAVLLGLLSLVFSMKIFRQMSSEKCEGMMGLVLLTSFYFFLTARSGMWDIFAQGFTIVAIYFYMQLMTNDKENGRMAILFGCLMAASFMSKGPVAIYGLFFPFLIAYHFFYLNKRIWNAKKIRHLILGVLIAIVLSAAWPLYIYFSEAGSAAAAIVKTESQNWSTYHVKPFYHYWSFPIQSGIWALYGFGGLIGYALSYKHMKTNRSLKFYFWWTIAVILLLSIIPEKKERYLLPVLFPMTMFISQLVQSSLPDRFHQLIRAIGGLTALIIGALGIAILFGLHDQFSTLTWRIPGGIALVLFSVLALASSYANSIQEAVVWIGISVIAVVLFFIQDIGKLMNDKNAVNSFERIASETKFNRLPLYSTIEMRPELVWAIKNKAPVLWTCELPTMHDEIGVFSYERIETELDTLELSSWDIISEELFDQNPVASIKKPNIALKRYFAILKKK